MTDYYSDIKEIINLIESPSLQKELWPAKVVFIFFSVSFFAIIIYFMFTSSYLEYQFIIDLKAFFGWQPSGLKKIIKRWEKIKKRMESGIESDIKLSIIEADDLFRDVLEDKGVVGKTLEEKIKQVEKIQLPNQEEILEAHKIRNSIVYDPNYKLDLNQAEQILGLYERAIKNIEAF